jgi:threonine/homoserine/homoserine lactone efflux protein
MTYLLLGLTLGLSAGVTPGPLLALVITASLRRGRASGLLVALAPLITDAPIIALSVLVLDRLPSWALTVVALAGGLLVIYLGVEALRSARGTALPAPEEDDSSGSELWKGTLVNALSPHPYLFWATVGGPTLLAGWQESPAHGLAFVAGFYTLLVGSKVFIAWLVGSHRHRLSLRPYRVVLTVLGVIMVVLGVLLIREAWIGHIQGTGI